MPLKDIEKLRPYYSKEFHRIAIGDALYDQYHVHKLGFGAYSKSFLLSFELPSPAVLNCSWQSWNQYFLSRLYRASSTPQHYEACAAFSIINLSVRRTPH
jgi:hypothetical protein